MLEQRLTERERNEVQLERDTARRARARDAALSPGTDAAVARCVDEETLGRKAIANLMENSDAHCVDALRDDVRVCLSSLAECGVDAAAPGNDDAAAAYGLGVARVSVFGADRDELVPPAATVWLAARLPEATLHFFTEASHSGVQMLRRDAWLAAAATDGAKAVADMRSPVKRPFSLL